MIRGRKFIREECRGWMRVLISLALRPMPPVDRGRSGGLVPRDEVDNCAGQALDGETARIKAGRRAHGPDGQQVAPRSRVSDLDGPWPSVDLLRTEDRRRAFHRPGGNRDGARETRQ